MSNGKREPFYASAFEFENEFGGIKTGSQYNPTEVHIKVPSKKLQNTTIAIVATDAKLTKSQATRMATVSHDGMARAIIPSHTPIDGDLIFSASTGDKNLSNPIEDELLIGHGASICLARSIARAIYTATAKAKDIKPTFND